MYAVQSVVLLLHVHVPHRGRRVMGGVEVCMLFSQWYCYYMYNVYVSHRGEEGDGGWGYVWCSVSVLTTLQAAI